MPEIQEADFNIRLAGLRERQYREDYEQALHREGPPTLAEDHS